MKKTVTILSCALFLRSAVIAQTTLPTIPNYVSRNGLVGWWGFSGNAGDSSGKGNHGIVKDAQLTTDRRGFENSAYEFDGNGDYINVADHPTLRCRRVTMSTWVYQRNTSSAPQNQVIYKGNFADANSEAYSINMKLQSGVKVNSSCRAGQGWQLLSFNQPMPVNSWMHICTTFDGDSLHNYLNGSRVSSAAVSGKIDSCIGSDLRFGYNHNIYQNGDAFLGKIDDIGVWNRALSPAEVEALYTGIPVPSGIEKTVQQVGISLFPNPGRNPVVITRQNTSTPLWITVTDLTGRVVLQESFAGAQKDLNLQGSASGMYVVTVTDAQGTALFREKLLVQ